MGRWADIAVWRGPTPNQGPAMVEQRGVVVHIAEGTFEGTIAWCRNPSADVSAHFVVARDGRIAQLVDTGTAAWTQRAGNGRWLSIENEGRTPGALTDAQVAANALILTRAHQAYGVPLQLATSPSGRGLGHHSMGVDWGHQDCPGPSIIAQKPLIVARAKALITGGDDEMPEILPPGEPGHNPHAWALAQRQRMLYEGRESIPGEEDYSPQPHWLVVTVRAIAADVAAIGDRLAALEARPPVQAAPVDVAGLAAALGPALVEAARQGAELASDS